MQIIDEIGNKHGRLTVVARGASVGKATWDCVCECGATVVAVMGTNLRNGHTRSCGCLKLEGFTRVITKHGMKGTPEYKAWKNIRSRCYNKADKGYEGYGGRGIKVCDRWFNFSDFLADVGMRPGADFSLDRVDNNGDYEPGNVRWATKAEQANNRRTSKLLEFEGVTKTLADWCKLRGMNYGKVLARLRNGWSVDRAFS